MRIYNSVVRIVFHETDIKFHDNNLDIIFVQIVRVWIKKEKQNTATTKPVTIKTKYIV